MPVADPLGALSVPEGVPMLLRDLVHERTGIFFDVDRFDTMLEKLRDRALRHRCSSYLDYYYLLKYDNPTEEWLRVVDAFSVQETYFWREASQIDALVKTVVPALLEARTPVRIWSAACASGEEPYSIAMALLEAGLGNAPIEIVASDASEAALEKARRGIYRERSFRGLPEWLRQKYFRSTPEGWQLAPEILRRVTFHRANLIEAAEIQDLARAPAVFCRNVFIYFSTDSIRRTLNVFTTQMPLGGHLFIGASESLLKLTHDFALREIDGAFVYVRVPAPAAPPVLGQARATP